MAKENITRIKIPKDSDKPKKEVKRTKAATDNAKASPVAATPKKSRKRPNFGFLRRFFGYFAGAWQELRVVRWPSRSMTWSYTLAVIIFSIVMAIFIILLDLGLNELSRKVIGG